MLDVVEERWDDAVDRFDSAAAKAAGLGARGWEARALAWASHARAQRGAPGDSAAARSCHDRAVALAVEGGHLGLLGSMRALGPPT